MSAQFSEQISSPFHWIEESEYWTQHSLLSVMMVVHVSVSRCPGVSSIIGKFGNMFMIMDSVLSMKVTLKFR